MKIDVTALLLGLFTGQFLVEMLSFIDYVHIAPEARIMSFATCLSVGFIVYARKLVWGKDFE